MSEKPKKFSAVPYCLITLFAIFVATLQARAHEIRPSIIGFTIVEPGRFELAIRTNLEALIAGIGAEHADSDDAPEVEVYNHLRQLSPEQLQARFGAFEADFVDGIDLSFDGSPASFDRLRLDVPEIGDVKLARDSILFVNGAYRLGAGTLQWAWAEKFGAGIFRVENIGEVENAYAAMIRAGQQSDIVSLRTGQAIEGQNGPFGLIGEYIAIGFAHILPKGLDHILFVVGLFLLSTRLSALVWQTSAFTLAHTITLGLGALGVAQISPAIVEPLIAASIAVIAIENIVTDRLHKWRPIIVFLFGLLHGLGFAGVLGEIGLPQSGFITALLAFNIGVELGQLAVIALCFVTVGLWFGKKPFYRHLIVIPASVFIAVIALYWTVERLGLV